MEAVNAATHNRQQAGARRVKVYRFRRYSAATGECFPSQTYATQEAIERFDAAIIVSSMLEVAQSDLDANGSYDPPLRKQQIIASHAPKENQLPRTGK